MADKNIFYDIEDFKVFYLETFPSICIFAEKYVADHDIAQDIAQESFISIWNKKPRMDTMEEIRYYLYRIVKNRCLNHLKKMKLKQAYLLAIENDKNDQLFDSQIIEQETFLQLRKAIKLLGNQTQTVINLSLQGYGNIEISEYIGISINTVKTLKRRAFSKLSKVLREHFYSLLL